MAALCTPEELVREPVVEKTVTDLVGTALASDAPLMGAGLDSIAATELRESTRVSSPSVAG